MGGGLRPGLLAVAVHSASMSAGLFSRLPAFIACSSIQATAFMARSAGGQSCRPEKCSMRCGRPRAPIAASRSFIS